LAILGMNPQINLDESAPLVHSGDNYNYTKILAEELIQRYVARGFPAVILRPPYIYGPRDRQFFPRLVGMILKGSFRFIGSGANPITLVYVGNLVEAMVLAARNDRAAGQVFIITDGESITRRELVELICERLGVELPEGTAPVWFARFGVHLLEILYKALHLKGTPIINRFRLKFMHTPLTFNIEKARRELGYKPLMSTREALALSVDWYRKHVLRDDEG